MAREMTLLVTPAKAGVQANRWNLAPWIPAFAGMTNNLRISRGTFRVSLSDFAAGSDMAKVLIIHGAGMNMRGKVQTEIFGPMTLPEYDERIRGYAAELGLEVEIFHSNIEGEVVNKLYEANDRDFDAALFNPAGYSRGYPALVA